MKPVKPLNIDNTEDILVAGDWHGFTHQALNAINLARQLNIPTILHVGDFGFYNTGTSQRYLKTLNLALKGDKLKREKPITLYAIDGNHEDHTWLNNQPIQPNGLQKIRSNIHRITRGTVITWGEKIRIGGVGGAFSIDYKHRKPGVSWWPVLEEAQPTEVERMVNSAPIHILLTHDSPAGLPNPITDNPLGQNQAAHNWGWDAIDNSNRHRETLRPLNETLQPDYVIHGHYHIRFDDKYFHPNGKITEIIGLDEGVNIKGNTVVLSYLETVLHVEDNIARVNKK